MTRSRARSDLLAVVLCYLLLAVVPGALLVLLVAPALRLSLLGHPAAAVLFLALAAVLALLVGEGLRQERAARRARR